MSATLTPFPICRNIPLRCAVALALLLSTSPLLNAQTAIQTAVQDPPAPEATLTLPDAPGYSTTAIPDSPEPGAADAALADDPPAHPVRASVRAKFIFPNQTAPPLSPTDKFYLGLIHGISLYSATGWIFAAEYEQVTNGTPNYGTNLGAYGQRLGAAALRGYTEEVLGTSLLAPLLHEDPRFYKLGNRHNVVVRTAYAVTRTIITRDDSGHLTPNLSLVGGNLLGSALTNAYYPPFNRGFNQTLKTFEGSMGGAAFGFFADEFLKDKLLTETMVAVHLRHR